MSRINKVTRTTLPAAPVSIGLSKVRLATTLYFALGGFLFAGWAVRIPAVKQQTGASPGALGIALLAMSVSAVITMPLTGKLCVRFGSIRIATISMVIYSLAVALPALGHSALSLGLLLLVFGGAYGAIDVAINSVAVDLVAALDRPIMSNLHAANSIGSLAGAGAGGLVAGFLSPALHLALLAPVGLALALVGARMLRAHPLPHVEHQVREHRRRGSLPGGWVILFALVALCAAYSQGGLDNWVPLHLTADLGAAAGMAAAGYAVVQCCLALGRLGGAGLIQRWGQTRVVLGGGLASAAGVLVAAWSPYLWLAFAGLAVAGLGLANIFPAALAGAGRVGGPNGVAFASTLGYGGIMLAPPTIGFVADGFGLPVALSLIAFQVALAAGIAFFVKNEKSRFP